MKLQYLFFSLGTILGLCLVSCKSHQPIAVVQSSHEHERSNYTKDSIDRGVFHTEITRIDTISINDTVFVNTQTIIHDSIYITMYKHTYDTATVVDIIPKPYPVVQYIEKQLSWLQSTLIYVGCAAILGLTLYIIIVYARKRLRH